MAKQISAHSTGRHRATWVCNDRQNSSRAARKRDCGELPRDGNAIAGPVRRVCRPIGPPVIAEIVIAVVVALALTGCESSNPPSNQPSATRMPTIVSTLTATSAPSTPPAASSTSQTPAADPADYKRDSYYYFISPSGRWQCGIVGPFNGNWSAGCHGPFPADAPPVPASARPGELTRPNTIRVRSDGSAAEFEHRGDPAYVPESRDARALPYRSVLTVGPMTCSIDSRTGVTCTDTATNHGFTISDADYELR